MSHDRPVLYLKRKAVMPARRAVIPAASAS